MSNKYTPEQEAQAQKIALQIAEELAGGLQNIIVCTGCKDFLALTAEPEKKYIGGLAFRYPRRFASNHSNEVRIFAMEDGTRKLEWGYVSKKGYLPLETEEGVAPEKLEEVWWEHTACTVRPPWFVEACRIKLKLGRTVVTPMANKAFTQEEIAKCMKRHSYVNLNPAPELGLFLFPNFDAPPIVSASCYGCSGGQNLKHRKKNNYVYKHNRSLCACAEPSYFYSWRLQ